MGSVKDMRHMSNSFGRYSKHVAALAILCAGAGSLSAQSLQGQNKGDTNTWSSVNLQGWLELDYVPLRVYFPGGSAGTQAVRIDFPHLSATIPGFEDLSAFKAITSNAKLVSAPTLTTDASGTWSYSFSVNVADQNPAEVRFFGRLAAGSHLNGGSSLQLKGTAGNLQIHKPAPGAGAPDLAIAVSGPASALPGSIINYSLSYTNQTATNTAIGAQVSHILPPKLIALTNGLAANARVVGNTVFWDIGNIAGKGAGQLSLQAMVDPAAAPGTVLTNLSQILSSEDDANLADNTCTVLTTVVCGGIAPAIFSSPTSVTSCPGSSVTFSVAASSGVVYQWRKDGTPIAGATDAIYTIASASKGDAGLYDVSVSTACGTVTSAVAMLTLNYDLPANITQRLLQADGTFQLQFTTGCGGTYYVQYSDDLLLWKTSAQPVAGNGALAQWVDSGPPSTDSLPSSQVVRFYRVVRTP